MDFEFEQQILDALKIDFYQQALDSLGIVEVTKWSTVNGEYVHNHIELGHCANNVPTGTPEQTRTWKNQKWSKRLTYGTYVDGVLVLD